MNTFSRILLVPTNACCFVLLNGQDGQATTLQPLLSQYLFYRVGNFTGGRDCLWPRLLSLLRWFLEFDWSNFFLSVAFVLGILTIFRLREVLYPTFYWANITCNTCHKKTLSPPLPKISWHPHGRLISPMVTATFFFADSEKDVLDLSTNPCTSFRKFGKLPFKILWFYLKSLTSFPRKLAKVY